MKLSDHPDYAKLFDLTGKVALVVGGGSGIGQASALGLAAHGAVAVVADLNEAGAKETAAEIQKRGGKAEARFVDARLTDSVNGLIDAVVAKHGGIDVLLAMPAMNIRKRLCDYTDEEFDRVIDLNLKGTFRQCRAVGNAMKKGGRGGSIILMSSMRGFNTEPGQSIYGSTKAAIHLLAKTLATELAPYDVRVNALAPSIIATPLNLPIREKPDWNNAYAGRTALKRWGETWEMAGAVIFLASKASSYVTATTIPVDAGWMSIDGRYDPPIA